MFSWIKEDSVVMSNGCERDVVVHCTTFCTCMEMVTPEGDYEALCDLDIEMINKSDTITKLYSENGRVYYSRHYTHFSSMPEGQFKLCFEKINDKEK